MLETSTVREERLGDHLVSFEPPDLFKVQFIGNVSAEELVGVGRAFARAPGRFYAVIYTAKLTSLSSAAKRSVRKVPLASGLAIVGASRQMQLMLSLMNRVYMMVNFGKNSPITFVASEAEALRWIDQIRSSAAAS